jgi:hypothetical protein
MTELLEQTISLPINTMQASTTTGMLVSLFPGVQSTTIAFGLREQMEAQGIDNAALGDYDPKNDAEMLYTISIRDLHFITGCFEKVAKMDLELENASRYLMPFWIEFFRAGASMVRAALKARLDGGE